MECRGALRRAMRTAHRSTQVTSAEHGKKGTRGTPPAKDSSPLGRAGLARPLAERAQAPRFFSMPPFIRSAAMLSRASPGEQVGARDRARVK